MATQQDRTQTPASLSTMPQEIKDMIIDYMWPVLLYDEPLEQWTEQQRVAQRESDRVSIRALNTLIRLDRRCYSFIDGLYAANRAVSERTEARLDVRIDLLRRKKSPALVGGPAIRELLGFRMYRPHDWHLGSCGESSACFPPLKVGEPACWKVYRKLCFKSGDPSSISSVPTWIASLSPANAITPKEALENVMPRVSDQCRLQHVSVALRFGNYAIAEKMLSLDHVRKELDDMNTGLHNHPRGLDNSVIPISPTHPVFAVTCLPGTDAMKAQWMRRFLPASSPYLATCFYEHNNNVVSMAARNGDSETLRLLLDHATEHLESGCVPSALIEHGLFASASEAQPLAARLAVKEVIASRFCGFSVAYGLVKSLRGNVAGVERKHALELGWKYIFNRPEEEWPSVSGGFMWSTDLVELWLERVIPAWDVQRISQILERYRNSVYFDRQQVPYLRKGLKAAAELSDHDKALAIVKLIWEYNDEYHAPRHPPGSSRRHEVKAALKRRRAAESKAMTAAQRQGNETLVRFFDAHDVPGEHTEGSGSGSDPSDRSFPARQLSSVHKALRKWGF